MTTPAWHEEAKRLFADGVSVGQISRLLGKAHGTVAWAVNLNNTRQRNYERVRAQRGGLASTVVRPPVRSSRKKLAAVAAPEPAPIEHAKKPTLPHISLPPLVDDEPIIRKFAPRTRIKPSSSGAERWRQIHRAMIRAGKLPEPGLPEQLHH